jgi:hypothetical protein
VERRIDERAMRRFKNHGESDAVPRPVMLIRPGIAGQALRSICRAGHACFYGVGVDVTELASLAANTVVATAATDAFEGVRGRVARLFGRGKPDPATERRLEATRVELSGRSSADAANVEAAQQIQWRVRFADLCEAYPEAAEELGQLITALRKEIPARGNVTNVISGGEQHGPIFMGRDFTGVTLHPDQGPSATQ